VAFKLTINGEEITVDVEPGMPLLWVLRDELGLTGTKFGCGIAACGACTVHVNGVATRTCVLPVEAVDGAEVTTIEGLGKNGLHPVQEAWIEHQVPQCGYCQSGMIMSRIRAMFIINTVYSCFVFLSAAILRLNAVISIQTPARK